ncbi:MAG TPA: sigma 54-interacting transcriptional regulator [Pyrinomonadaceae bacterium]|jgi:transcriptional regulator with GAF, ATPase, and Fis domain|nr:sigma 54-interacting transcriptional regulator [Pyrinomonadaceae bacterium]
MEIWYCFLGRQPRADILNALNETGLLTRACESPPSNGPGIIFFDEITNQLPEVLRAASCRGAERVIAIALSRSAIKPAGIWRLLNAGASDVFAWDHSLEPAQEIAARFERWNKVDEIVRSPLVRSNLAGQSAIWIRSLRKLVEVASFTDSSVLLTGESGTGKELFAQLVHTLDPRASKGSLVVCDCTTIAPELSGSEFFGHERGAFTGAIADRKGAFALADGGTLFLDEVGELPLNMQAELLRVIQERTYKRVGGNSWQKTNFRLVCATNRNLVEEQSRDRFRRDLYYRIATWTCHLPPLCDRREDILVLARHFIEQLRPHDPPELDDTVRQYLQALAYPGNVRDLKQLVTRIVQHHVGPGAITVGDIPEDERPSSDNEDDWREAGLETAVRSAIASGASLKEIERSAGELAERIVIEEELGNLQRAAARLDVTDRALQMRRAARRPNGNGSGSQ